MPTFDGTNLTITLPSGTTSIDAREIYSAWKVWTKAGNANFLPAFRVIGGDPIGGGLFAGSYFFLRNDYGWRIKPPEENIDVTIRGNLYAQDSGQPSLLGTVGSFNTSLRLETSSLTQAITTDGGTVDPAPTATEVAAAVWNFTQ